MYLITRHPLALPLAQRFSGLPALGRIAVEIIIEVNLKIIKSFSEII